MKYECLKLEERRIIEAMYAEGAKPDEIAKRVGKCRATIYRELERGKTGETDSRFRYDRLTRASATAALYP